MAEGYLVEECLIFCLRYLSGVGALENRPTRNDDNPMPMSHPRHLIHLVERQKQLLFKDFMPTMLIDMAVKYDSKKELIE